MIFQKLHDGFEKFLEYITMLMVVVLAIIVMTGVVFRFSGHALGWYDEVASVMLAWVTYYGAALAAMKRAHISVPGLLYSQPRPIRMVLAIIAEACILAFFILLAWYGVVVLKALAGATLASVEVPIEIYQSVIPIGATLYVIAELLTLPAELRRVWEGKRPTIEDEIKEVPK